MKVSQGPWWARRPVDECETSSSAFAVADRSKAARRECDAELWEGVVAVLQALEVSESTLDRWRKQFGGMKSEEARRLKDLEEENKRLKEIVADQALDIGPVRPAAFIRRRSIRCP